MSEITSQEIQAIELQTNDVVQQAQAIAITDEATMLVASSSLKLIADTKKAIEAQRKFFVDPLNEQVKAINAKFKTLSQPLDEADSLIRRKISDHRAVQAEIARKEQERIDRLAAAKQAELDKKAKAEGVIAPKISAPVVATPPKQVGNVSTRKVWKFAIADSTVIPREYLTVDETKIRQAVQSGVRSIPGVNIYEDEQIVVR